MDAQIKKTFCENCGKDIKGRSDKRFCDDNCRNTFNHKKKIPDNETMSPVVNILKKNRSILSTLYAGDNQTLTKMELVALGYNFDYCTDRRLLQGIEYYFCFDFGYEILISDEYAILSTGYFDFIYGHYLHHLPNIPTPDSNEPEDVAYCEMLSKPLTINSEIKEPPKSSKKTNPDIRVVE